MAFSKAAFVLMVWSLVVCGCAPRSGSAPKSSSSSPTRAPSLAAQPPAPPDGAVAEPEIGSEANAATSQDTMASEVAEQTGTSPAVEPTNPEARTDSIPANPAPISIRELIERVDDAVVLITTEDAQGLANGVGSGFVVDGQGLVVTNYHVVRMATRAHVQMRDGRKIDIESVRGFDKGRDLAVLQLKEPPEDLETARLREPDELLQGDTLIAVGHPSGFKFTVTTGIVSAVRRTDELPDQFQQLLQCPDDQVWIQTNAAISHGNSGGPLFDQRGTLVGINTWLDPQGQNLGFATHVQYLIELMSSLPGESQPLPIPGSLASRTLTNPQVISIYEAFSRELQEFQQKTSSTNLFSLLSKPKHPAAARVKELIELADANKGTDTEFQALWSACSAARTKDDETEEAMQQILERLNERHADDPRLDNIAIDLASMGKEDAFAFLRKLLADSPHRHIRATACYCLATGLASSPRGRSVQPEVVHYFQQSMDEYGDLYLEVYGASPPMNLKKLAEQMLFGAKFTAIGKTPPNIEGKDHAGQPLELADYRGKVVVLSFSADWDEACRKLYEHKRRWSEQYADQPFAVLDVSLDAPDQLARLVNQKTATWRSWSDGPKGPITKAWYIQMVPTVLVLDRQGVVRSALVPSGNDFAEKIEAAIEQTLAQPFADLPEDLLASGATWKFVVPAEDLDGAWRDPEFDDAKWEEGATPLGFGLYDEATALPFDPIATKRWTTLLRGSFELADPTAAQDVVLSLWCDDGAAVYLNGTEVSRLRLGHDVAIDDSATFDDLSDGRIAFLEPIDTKLLVEGRNVIAVEVHQAERSSDLRFDLSVSSNVIPSHLERAAGDEAVVQRLDAIQMLGRLGPTASAAVPTLDGLLHDEDMRVRARALEALLLIDPSRSDDEVPEASDKDEKEFRDRLNQWLNNESWSLGFAKNNTASNYERAWRLINAACVLAPKQAAALNTKGTVEYRLGRHEDALRTLNESLRIQRSNPFDHAVIAMANYQLNQVEKARQALDKAQKALQLIGGSANRDEAESLVNEALLLIGESSTEKPSPFE